VTCGLYGENREFEKAADQFFKTSGTVMVMKTSAFWRQGWAHGRSRHRPVQRNVALDLRVTGLRFGNIWSLLGFYRLSTAIIVVRRP
jgi:hypothetical protein